MNKTIGYTTIAPLIKTARFPKMKIVLELVDGRILIVPADKFPEIEQLSASQKRSHKTLAGMGLMFESLDTVFHISDFMGKADSSETFWPTEKPDKKYTVKTPAHSKAAEPIAKYSKRKL